MRELHLFAGAGGGILGGMLLGHTPVCAVEIEPYCRSVLLQRQRDGILPVFPVWDDVRTFDGKPWRGRVDVICGGFPCQDISAAGKGAGIDGERSGLWSEFKRIIGEVRPRFAFVENSPRLTSRGLGRVLGDLAEMGYDCRWGCVSAEDAVWIGGTPAMDHLRERIWIFAEHADADSVREQQRKGGISNIWGRSGDGSEEACQFCGYPFDIQSLGKYGCPNCNGEGLDEEDSNAMQSGREEKYAPALPERTRFNSRFPDSRRPDWWITEPDVGRVAHGVVNRVDRIKALGNGQVPAVVALAWNILTERRKLTPAN